MLKAKISLFTSVNLYYTQEKETCQLVMLTFSLRVDEDTLSINL